LVIHFKEEIKVLVLISIVTFLATGILVVSLISFFQVKNGSGVEALSIVVAIRNEPNLKNLIERLVAQLAEQDEIIVVNDHSALPLSLPEQVKVINLKGTNMGKKRAVYEGVHAAKNPQILTLDGDVSVPKGYLRYLRNNLPADKDCVVLPLKLKGKGVWNKLSNLELISLNALGIGMANLNQKLLANGANFSFKKEHYLNNFERHKEVASGDDSFTLLYAKNVGAIFDSDNIPSSDNDLNFLELLNQRIRWAGKTKCLPMTKGLFLGQLLSLMKLSIPGLIILNMFLWHSMPIYYLLLLYWAIDFLFLFLVSFRYGEGRNIAYIPVLVTFYPLYLWLMLFCMIFMRPTWKGRKI
jgi:cellulose synthase/poly-beta-1,6-N-acetylglucosamine synthase-like glycosyltransferase